MASSGAGPAAAASTGAAGTSVGAGAEPATSPGRGARRKLWSILGEKKSEPAAHAELRAAQSEPPRTAAATQQQQQQQEAEVKRSSPTAAGLKSIAQSQPQLSSAGGAAGGAPHNEHVVRVNTAQRGRPIELNELMFVQCLRDGHRDGINVMEFSPEGMFLATGGKDATVVIWRVLQHDKEQYEQTEPQPVCEGAGNTSGEPLGPKLFSSDPWQVLRKHTKEITSLSWSRSQFLLSGSADCTVRLWHVQRDQCLYVFRHRNVVTGVSFSPETDLRFASSAEDGYVRLWDIEGGADGIAKVIEIQKIAGGVRSLAFFNDPNVLSVGTEDGEVRFLSSDKLVFVTQMECRNRRGIQRKGKPVVGLQPCSLRGSLNKNSQQSAILVSTKDSRVRLCSMGNYAVLCKFKGASTTTLDIKARIKGSRSHVISASEDKSVYIWNLVEQEPDNAAAASLANSKRLLGAVAKKYSTFESFQGHSTMVTQADFAPDRTLRVARKRTVTGPSLHGCIIVSTDLHGHIHVFENKLPTPDEEIPAA
ncbi:WD repeat-containing protein 44 [Hondaea fermentalgiana]|uniref:WD repeat-containing protein 44 n=1 Tax=Hondaea fermentalgiana TaxID=2315210 RepID=A0A2R5G288_9STRA|nr:WD repeat-containing protein 44 [Hondaea fermentalgiana]|eukprot:GBG25102.1 WD repeat-containing protein 44 [Hondaea fermentalgiana]